MSNINVLQMPAFKRTYKKLRKQSKNAVDDAVRDIIKNPTIETEKKGDLVSVFVYKFKIHRQEMLLAYEWDPKTRILHTLGAHENFYRDFKKGRS